MKKKKFISGFEYSNGIGSRKFRKIAKRNANKKLRLLKYKNEKP